MTVRIIVGNCLEELRKLPSDSVHCAVTSPPYWGLRDYGIEPQVWGGDPKCAHEFVDEEVERSIRKGMGLEELGKRYRGGGKKHGRIATFTIHRGSCAKCGAWRGAHGLEPTWQLYVEHAVMIFREVRRVLRPDGTLWLNLGDCYATGAGAVGARPGGGAQGDAWAGTEPGYRGGRSMEQSGKHGTSKTRAFATNTKDPKSRGGLGPLTQPNRMPQPGLKPKDLVGIPWRVAFALQEDGWWLRQEIIWAKPNPMPESIRDRCTKAHEQIFLLAKSERYFFDADAIAEDSVYAVNQEEAPKGTFNGKRTDGTDVIERPFRAVREKRNKRTVWTVSTKPFAEAHFATFPTDLIEPCIKAGCPIGGTVLDPFGGAGTTGLVADRLRRDAILLELNPKYAEMARRRIENDGGLFSTVAAE